MSSAAKPGTRPSDPHFSSGPTAKRPGWSLAALEAAQIGRFHRSAPSRQRIKEVIDRSRAILGVPDSHLIAIVPASDTGAVSMAMWNLLGQRGVDLLAWESFGANWVHDVTEHLRLEDARVFQADFGELPDLAAVDPDRDVVFTWNGTTSGVRVPNGDWISPDRGGLMISDATSAAFGMDLPWDKLDVVTYSWQKVMGGEGGQGMLIIGPRAVERLESYTPPWPMPKILRLTEKGKLIGGLFDGAVVNTLSLLCVEDAIDALKWAEDIGGLEAMIGRTETNAALIFDWTRRTEWIDFWAADPATRSTTSICLKFVEPWFRDLDPATQAQVPIRIDGVLDTEGVAYDLKNSSPDRPPNLRIWAGATVEPANLEALFPWIEWAYATVKEQIVAES